MAKLLFTDGAHPLARELANLLRGHGHDVTVNNDPIDSKEAVRALLSRVGVPDGLIVSTYTALRGGIEDGDADAISRDIERGLVASFHALRHFGAAMTERGHGSIIFLSSLFADKPTGSSLTCSLTQGALQMMMKELALYYGNMGLTVNMIKLAPTEAEDAAFDSTLVQACYDIPTKAPSGLRVTAEDALGALEYFLSPAARNVNGADIRIDGGLLYHYIDRRFVPVKEADL